MRSLLALLLFASTLSAAPPTFDPPTTIPVVSGVAVWQPPADVVSVAYVGLDGEEEFPLGLIGGSKTAFAFITRGLPPGKQYRFVGVAASATGEQVERLFTVTIPGGPVTPPPVDPTDPPVTPPTTGKVWFVVVRTDVPSDPGFTKVMEMPEWQTLKAKGYGINDLPLKEATALGIKLPAGTTLPTVVTLQDNEATKKSKVIRGPVAFPTTGAAILKLPEGLK